MGFQGSFLPAWQELQLQQHGVLGTHEQTFLQPSPRPAQTSQTPPGPVGGPCPPGPLGLVFPGELTDEKAEKEKRRKQQQEMQNALEEQIKEQRARKEQQRRQQSEETGSVLVKCSPRPSPLHQVPQAALEEDAERERKRLQQQELQRALAVQVEEAKRRKEEARRRQEQEDAKEEERLRREIAEEKLIAVKRFDSQDFKGCVPETRDGRLASHGRRDVRDDSRDLSVREEPGRTMKKSRDRLREDSWRDADRGLRKTRDKLRDPRASRRRPRTRDSVGMSPPRDVQSPVPSTVFGPADTAGTWVGTCTPSPPHKLDGELGFQGFVEQQRLLASEMQRQVAELRNQRDEAREEALKVKEDAINDRARHLQELQQCLLEQLQVKPSQAEEVPKMEHPEASALEASQVLERSIISDSRFVAIDAALTALLSKTDMALPAGLASQRKASLDAQSQFLGQSREGEQHFEFAPFLEAEPEPVEHEQAWTRTSEACGSPGASPLTEQLDKEKVAAFRKALDTADGLPAELRQDLCALLEESTPKECERPGSLVPPGSKGRPPPCKGDLKLEASPFPQRALTRPSVRARSSTPGSKLTPRTSSNMDAEERRAQSAIEPRREEASWAENKQAANGKVRRRSEALAAAACGIIGTPEGRR